MDINLFVLFFIFALSSDTSGLPSLDIYEATSTEKSLAKIVNGYEVDITEVPYQSTLRRRVLTGWAHICGAVIISENALLTAAHCTITYVDNPFLLRAAVGTAFRLSEGKNYELLRIIVHETYSSLTLEDDISILITRKRMSFSSTVNAVPLARPNHVLPAGSEAVVSGFGSISYEGSASLILLATRVKVVGQEVCARAYLRIASITNGMLCAHASNPPRDACQGDSGGPLVANNTLIGIVSWGEGCANPDYPGVYTRVSEYYTWILSNL